MVRRSVLFTPGDRPEMLRKAADSGADVIVFDLEDAVSPDRKGEARTTVREVLSDSAFDPDCEVCVRLNASSEAFGDDLAVLLEDSTSLRLDSVMRPKVESAADIDELEAELEAHDEPRPVLALLESAAGILAAPDVAAAEATDALVFGAEDLSADLGATRTPEGTEVLYARQRVVVAAAAHDCVAIDTLVTDFGNDERLREDAAVSVQLGYDGKLAIHPAQVAPINEAFTPSIEEREWAEAVLEAKREANKAGRGVFEVDGEMIDAPLIAQAERILERTRAANYRK
ncbi:HpcH/HpaI aldolase/citrate lyase family protein [Natrarchaeobaculum sulfurireducens]|uniref:Hydroxymethylglutaryl-CoA lyase n=1 Tax=Natrarchaeobaculum sulfurireducens TaxID=2044521 RepID=A0A346PNK4_9EURY|nr:CoA ester lyase [Natrarchaeobaculum sulfurireducens]AXR81099.1 Hydroxymethylglutaryl-CoA lyase [Natrarchaeobaculum sulfurireducens]